MIGIRKLSDQEKIEWTAIAKQEHDLHQKMSKNELLAAMERAQCEAEKAEIAILVIGRLLEAKGDDTYYNPIPCRKSLEAVRLAFPNFIPKLWGGI